jgi:hypothetical protein
MFFAYPVYPTKQDRRIYIYIYRDVYSFKTYLMHRLNISLFFTKLRYKIYIYVYFSHICYSLRVREKFVKHRKREVYEYLDQFNKIAGP